MSQRTLHTIIGSVLVVIFGLGVLIYLFHPKPLNIPKGYPVRIVLNRHKKLLPAVDAHAINPRMSRSLNAQMAQSQTGKTAQIVLAYLQAAEAIPAARDPITKGHLIRFNLDFTPNHSWVLPWHKNYVNGIDSITNHFFASDKLDNLAYHIMSTWMGGGDYQQVVTRYLGYDSGHTNIDYRYAIVNINRQLLSFVYMKGFLRSGKFIPMPSPKKVGELVRSKGKRAVNRMLMSRLHHDIRESIAYLGRLGTGSQHISNQNAFVAVNYFIGPATVFAYEYSKLYGLKNSLK